MIDSHLEMIEQQNNPKPASKLTPEQIEHLERKRAKRRAQGVKVL